MASIVNQPFTFKTSDNMCLYARWKDVLPKIDPACETVIGQRIEQAAKALLVDDYQSGFIGYRHSNTTDAEIQFESMLVDANNGTIESFDTHQKANNSVWFVGWQIQVNRPHKNPVSPLFLITPLVVNDGPQSFYLYLMDRWQMIPIEVGMEAYEGYNETLPKDEKINHHPLAVIENAIVGMDTYKSPNWGALPDESMLIDPDGNEISREVVRDAFNESLIHQVERWIIRKRPMNDIDYANFEPVYRIQVVTTHEGRRFQIIDSSGMPVSDDQIDGSPLHRGDVFAAVNRLNLEHYKRKQQETKE